MTQLLENARLSIDLGIEDYFDQNPVRVLSAVRNFYSGVLLLAKATLVNKVPHHDQREILGTQFTPVPDGQGGISYKYSKKRQTVGFDDLLKRLKDFDISVDQQALKKLNAIRNDIEHSYSNSPREHMREAIATLFPIISILIEELGFNPHELMPVSWPKMLEEKGFYEKELELCRESFGNIKWESKTLAAIRFKCIECESSLVMQVNKEASNHEELHCSCRLCGHQWHGEHAIEAAIRDHLDWDSYLAMADCSSELIHLCHECGLNTYLCTEEEVGCVWCQALLEDCIICHTGLTPDNVSWDDHRLCGYCHNKLLKDD